MLKELMDKQNVSKYKLSKDTGIPYSTVCDILSGKTLIENATSNTLFRLAKYFNLSMESLYLSSSTEQFLSVYNKGRNVYIDYLDNHLMYCGPKNLVAFKRINKIAGNTICVECYFMSEDSTIYSEEDYIDLKDIFNEYDIDFDMNDLITVRIKSLHPSSKISMIDNTLLVSDNMAISLADSSTGDIILEISNINKRSSKMQLRLKDYTVLITNMSTSQQKKAIDAVKRNLELIKLEIEEVKNYA